MIVIVHALWHGQALCGLAWPPENWPIEHTWWAANQWQRLDEALDEDPRAAELCPICDRAVRATPSPWGEKP